MDSYLKFGEEGNEKSEKPEDLSQVRGGKEGVGEDGKQENVIS